MPIKRLSDHALVLKARRAEQIKQRVQDLNSKKADLEKEVMKEMERRHTRVIECDGVKLTRVQQEATVIDGQALLAVLAPRQRKLCTKTVFDRDGLNAAVGAGLIDITTVDRFSEIQAKSPYLVVTPVSP